MLKGALREALELAAASLIAAIVGVSLYLDARLAFQIGPREIVALSVCVFLVHDLAHKLGARLVASEGRFKLSLTGSAFSLLVAIAQNALTLTTIALKKALGLPPAGAWKIAPYRLITPGTVVAPGRQRRDALGKIAAAGPASSLALGWLMFFAASVVQPASFKQVLLLGSALNAYTALSGLLPVAFCDGLTIYWWSKGAWVAILLVTAVLIAASNITLFTMP